ncbi:MAG: MBL fold metallo-hydrolase [Terriglobia bacterium]
MIHEILPVGPLACNCSILGDEASGEALVVDPGGEIDRVQEVLNRHHLTVKAIVATHAHIDHVGGIEKLHRATGAPVFMHQADLFLYENLAAQAAWLGVDTPGAVTVEKFLKEGDAVRAGSLRLDVLWTPGHSPGSLSLYLPGEAARLFSGDTLFKESVGRTDLWGGDSRQILRSIEDTLFRLPDATPVFPGHGPSTTIGHERERNPFLRNL